MSIAKTCKEEQYVSCMSSQSFCTLNTVIFGPFFFSFSVHSLHRQASNFVLHYHFPPHQKRWIWENSGLKCHQKSQRKTVADRGMKFRPFKLTSLGFGYDLISREKHWTSEVMYWKQWLNYRGRNTEETLKEWLLKASLASLFSPQKYNLL